LKKLAIILSILTLGASIAFAHDDRLFVENIKNCNPYKSVFKVKKTGEVLEKGVIGIKAESSTGNLYCVYYTQRTPSQYQLCQQITGWVPGTSKPDRKVSCRTVGFASFSEEEQSMNTNDYFIDTGVDTIMMPVKP
jgi:hypothetical protein